MESGDINHRAKDLANHVLAELDEWEEKPGFRECCDKWARVALASAVAEERLLCLELVQSHMRCSKYCSVGPDTSHDADCLANLVQVLKENAP